jgi:hypothetical protein
MSRSVTIVISPRDFARTSSAMRSIRCTAAGWRTCAKSFTSPDGGGIWIACGRRKSVAVRNTANSFAVDGKPNSNAFRIYSPLISWFERTSI